MTRRRTAALLTALLVSVGLADSPANAAVDKGTHVAGGIIADDTTWTAANSPYLVDGPLQIADNATLRLEPGVQVEATAAFTAAASMFGVAGTLEIAGTQGAPVVIDGNGAYGLANGLKVNTDALVEITHATVTDFQALVPATGNSQHANYAISDSSFSSMPGLTYFWYPHEYARLERNLFVDVGALTFGTDRDAVATVTNNRFRGTSTDLHPRYRHQLESWAAYGQPLQVHGNTFEPAPGQTYALTVVTDGVADATGNDWGTTDLAAVKARILDREDDLNLPSAVPVEPLLAGPAAATPVAPPTAPRNVAATATDSAAQVRWTPPLIDGGAPVTGYTVTASPGAAHVQVPAGQVQATIAGLVNGVAYTFTVTAGNAAGESVPSAPSAPVTPAGAPSPPTNLTARPADQRVTVTWTAAAPNGAPVTGYTVTSHPNGSSVTVPGTQTHATIGELTNGTPYEFTVTASNAAGTSAPSTPSPVTIPAGAPLRMKRPTATVHGSRVTLRWQPAIDNGSPVTGYRVVTAAGVIRHTGPAARSTVIKGLRPGRYRFRLVAVNQVGLSPASPAVRVRVRHR